MLEESERLQSCRGLGSEPWAEAGAGEMSLGAEIGKGLSRKDL